MRALRRVPTRLAWALGLAVVGVTLVVSLRTVDGETLRRALRALAGDPLGLGIALAAFAAAFVLRSWAWRRVMPTLPLGQAWAAISLALAANHVLPLRLGEVVRPLSAGRRTGLPLAPLTASTITLRAADILAMGLLGLLVGPRALDHLLGPWGWAALGIVAVAGIVSFVWLWRLRTGRDAALVRLPGLGVAAAAVAAWALEAVVVHQCASWAGHPISATDAILVTVAAVSAQVAAIAPGGIGTYEAAATAALVTVGIPAGPALAIAIVAHALKTAYSLGAGAVAAFWPSPSLVGHLRLARHASHLEPEPAPEGPIMLVLPAHDEGPRVAAVVQRLPATVGGRTTQCIVVDDGSTDDTAMQAASAGATVVRLVPNRGLGAAVRAGMAAAVDAGAAAVAFCDADGEYAPEELGELVAPVLAGQADYVVGSRFAGDIHHMRPHRRAGNQVLTRWVRWMTRAPVTDGQSGYRAFSRRAAADAEIVHDYNYAQVLTLDLLGKGYAYAEVPISYRFRSSGRSFVRLGGYLRTVLPAVHRELNTLPNAPRDHVPAPVSIPTTG